MAEPDIPQNEQSKEVLTASDYNCEYLTLKLDLITNIKIKSISVGYRNVLRLGF